MENEIALNEAIIDEREQGIREIQKEIGEVNEIFRDLAQLVTEQGALIGWSILTSSTYFLFSITNFPCYVPIVVIV